MKVIELAVSFFSVIWYPASEFKPETSAISRRFRCDSEAGYQTILTYNSVASIVFVIETEER